MNIDEQVMDKNKVAPAKEENAPVENAVEDSEDLIHITIFDREGVKHDIEVPPGFDLSLMEISQASGLPVEGTCGGMALCASCHCFIESDHQLNEPSDEELDMLDTSPYSEENSRLGCQIRVNESLDGLVVRLAETGED